MTVLEKCNGPGNGKRVLLAFSGGTDSCYSAIKLMRQGYSVEGMVMNMTGDAELIRDALERAESIGLPCYVADVREEFRSGVMDYFTGEYLRGRTPAPCTVCNPLVKWKTLYDTARAGGFDHIATGHYFRIAARDGQLHVAVAADSVKDQSYYLWMVPREVLSMALTPMGDEIKQKVVDAGHTPPQRESMGVCFLHGRDYREFLKERCPDHPACGPGPVTDREGKSIGMHDGCAFYTTGQKKGLELPPGHCVTGIDAGANTLISGPMSDIYYGSIVLENYILSPAYGPGSRIPEVRIRGYGQNPAGGCTVGRDGDNLALTLAEPAYAPALGQPAVLYDGEGVVGGGYICGFDR